MRGLALQGERERYRNMEPVQGKMLDLRTKADRTQGAYPPSFPRALAERRTMLRSPAVSGRRSPPDAAALDAGRHCGQDRPHAAFAE